MMRINRLRCTSKRLFSNHVFSSESTVMQSDLEKTLNKEKEAALKPKSVQLIGVFQKGSSFKTSDITVPFGANVIELLEKSGFKGKTGQLRTFYGVDSAPAFDAVAVVGLGKHSRDVPLGVYEEKENIRRSYGVAIKQIRAMYEKEPVDVVVETPNGEFLQEIAEGATLSGYRFTKFKTDAEAPAPALSFVLPAKLAQESGSELQKEWDTGRVYANAQNLARRLADTPANHMTPTRFCENVTKIFDEFDQVEVLVNDKEWIIKKKMGGLLSIAAGSTEPPKFLQIRYWGKAKGDESGCIALVGKGVTFDAGGISLKPSAGMGMMKGDMMGAASVVAAVFGAASLRLPLNIVAVVPLTENMPDGSAVKPGDVITSMKGKTIEIDNTDAEGRVILADALYYACKTYEPHTIIDVATLTGAMDVALGNVFAGFFTNSDKLAAALCDAGKTAGDRLWRLPLDKEYKPHLKSDVSDLKNAGGRSGGAISAAMFLAEFVENLEAPVGKRNVSWAHIDIAGVMHSKGDSYYSSPGMTGRPTRALIRYLQDRSRNVPVQI